MDRFSVEDLKKSIETLLDIVRCAVCLETVQDEIVQCVNGHLLCGGCKTGLVNCPTCREQFSEVKPSRTIAQVIEALPTQCKHKKCEVYVRPGGDDHEKYCGFQITDCKLCEWEGCAKDILEHLKEQHPSTKIRTGEMKDMYIINFEYEKEMESNNAYFVDGQFFWYTISNDPVSKLFIKTCHAVPIGKCDDKFYLKVMLNSKETEFVSKIILNLDPDVDDDENSIIIPWKTVPNYIDSDGDFLYNHQIAKEVI
uniref:RING-type domain-containing protein n=1 Tax=Graphocephala atropunctata TaxID=36148 RepID=A0A1B6MB28_9HEMI